MNDAPEFSDHEKKILTGLYNEKSIPSDLENKTMNALRDKGLFRKPLLKNYYFRLSFGVLLIAFIFYVGYTIGHGSRHAARPAGGNQEYLMLLSEPPGFISSASHVQEYSDWFNELRSRNIMSAGEELQTGGWVISKKTTGVLVSSMTGDPGMPSGFFIFNASSPEEAIKIASACPHLKYHGAIALRSIQNHP